MKKITFLLSVSLFGIFLASATSEQSTVSKIIPNYGKGATDTIIATDSCPQSYTNIYWYYRADTGWVSYDNNYECYNYDSLYFVATPYSSYGVTTQWIFHLNGATITKYGNGVTLSWSDFLPTTVNRRKKGLLSCINYFQASVKPIKDSCIVPFYSEDAYNPICTYTRNNVSEIGIDALKSNSTKIKLYPSPCVNNITITGYNNPSSENSITDFKIYNLDGRVVKLGTLKSQQTSVDVSSLKSGFYIIKTVYGNAIFIKQ